MTIQSRTPLLDRARLPADLRNFFTEKLVSDGHLLGARRNRIRTIRQDAGVSGCTRRAKILLPVVTNDWKIFAAAVLAALWQGNDSRRASRA